MTTRRRGRWCTVALAGAIACGGDDADGGASGDGSGGALEGGTDGGAQDGTSLGSEGEGGGDGGHAEVPGTCASFGTMGATALVATADAKPGGPSCAPTPAPCGGDPVGVWTVQESCGGEASIANPFASACPGAHFSPSPPRTTGLLTVDGAGHFELATTRRYDFTAISDAACFNAWSCGPEIVPGLVQFFGGSAVCSGDPEACTCTVTDAVLDTLHVSGEGAFGDHGALVGADDQMIERSVPYCVSDGGLQLWLTQLPIVTQTPCNDDADCTADGDRIPVCL